MEFLTPTSKYQVLKFLRKEGRTEFMKTLGGSYGFAEDWNLLVQWVLQDICSDTMLIFH
jgi:hypothetical protein